MTVGVFPQHGSMDSSSLSNVLSSAEVQAFASGFPVMVLHLAVTLALLVAGATVYALLTPWKEIALIRDGNPAAAVAFSGVLIGLAIPLAVSLSVSTSVHDIAIWGVATVVLQLFAFRIVDVLLTGLPQRIQDGEVPAAVLLVGAKLATALILSAALTG
jgi:putative membrane protein